MSSQPQLERWSDREVLDRLTKAAGELCEAAFASGHRWSCLYETSALVHGVRTIIHTEPRPMDLLTARGFCVDEWQRWHQGQCGTYATALILMDPMLRLGLLGEMDNEFFVWQHAFAHDDQYAYDAGGRHPLPYRGAWGDYDHQELDQDLKDHSFTYDEAGPEGEAVNLAAAETHARRNGILEGRFTPTAIGPNYE